MRAVVQRVINSNVTIDGNIKGEIGKGLLILIGVMQGDTYKDVEYIVKKCLGLRIFSDSDGKMNLSVSDINGELLIVSQFTLLGDARKGNRPSFILAGRPETTRELYDEAVKGFKSSGLKVETGEFGADMQVALVNDGPVTIMLDSRKVF